MMKKEIFVFLFILLLFSHCNFDKAQNIKILPAVVTEPITGDTDDPAIWVHPDDKTQSIMIGTDKGSSTSPGGLYVYRLDGSIDKSRCILGLHRPNNVDVEYGLKNGNKYIDIAVCTERDRNMIRVFRLPGMKPIDDGGIPVFEGEAERAPMGISLFKEPSTQKIYAIVGRKAGPANQYLFQYELVMNNIGFVEARFVRKFGKFSRSKEIESIVVDDELGYVYYSDEGVGVRKYYAHPDSSDIELALFGRNEIEEDHEGLSIYKTSKTKGYLLLSDQQANLFHVFRREGENGKPHQHTLLTKLPTFTRESDGSEVVNDSLSPLFANGLFVAMSSDGTFQYYRWKDFQSRIPDK